MEEHTFRTTTLNLLLFDFFPFKASQVWALGLIQRDQGSSLDSATSCSLLAGFGGTPCHKSCKAPALCLAHPGPVITKVHFVGPGSTPDLSLSFVQGPEASS